MSKARSIEQHRRLFAVMAATFTHWPERHPFQPQNAEHLRAWLLVKAKHSTIKTFYLDGDAKEYARVIPIITASMMGKHSWCRAEANALHVCVPESIAFDKCDHTKFCDLNNAIDEIIRAEIGLDPDHLLREKAA